MVEGKREERKTVGRREEYWTLSIVVFLISATLGLTVALATLSLFQVYAVLATCCRSDIRI